MPGFENDDRISVWQCVSRPNLLFHVPEAYSQSVYSDLSSKLGISLQAEK